MPLHSSTAITQLFVLATVLCLAMSWVAFADGKGGARSLAWAFGLEALGYLAAIFQVQLPSVFASLLMFGMVALAYALLVHALAEFQATELQRGWLWWPTLLAAVISLGLHEDALSRQIAISLLFLVLDGKALEILFRGKRGRTGRGRQLLSAGIAVNAAALFVRIAFSLSYGARWPLGAQMVQDLYSMSSLASLALIAIGFSLMAKEFAEEQIRVLAMQDGLTGCWNRVWIGKRARQEMLRLRRHGTPLSLVMIDIDHFKKVNDVHGHLAGDAVLQGFAARVAGCLRESDVFGRWGGEEFLLLLPSTGFPAAIQVAERVRAALAAAPVAQSIQISASFGVSSCLSTDGWEDWLSRADLALYRAKAGGRNRVEPEYPLQPAGVAAGSESVARLVWHDEIVSGVPQIDAQHRALFNGANHLLELHAYPPPGIDLQQEMRRFLKNVEYHFQTEEAILTTIASPQLTQHVGLHRQMTERANDLFDQHLAGKLAFADLLHFVVYELTAHHLLREDSQIRSGLPHDPAASPALT